MPEVFKQKPKVCSRCQQEIDFNVCLAFENGTCHYYCQNCFAKMKLETVVETVEEE